MRRDELSDARRLWAAVVLWLSGGVVAVASGATAGDPCEGSARVPMAAVAMGSLAALATYCSVKLPRPAAIVLSVILGFAAGGGLFFLSFVRWAEHCTA
jgi:hypothetical protein